MPKRKTGARKKAEQLKVRQKGIAARQLIVDLGKHPSNQVMLCDHCNRQQKNRAFCYFCAGVQKTPACGHCGKTKCMAAAPDCVVRHPGRNVTGMGMVGCVCDFCEAWLCHSRKCLTTHCCSCPLVDAVCIECERTVWEHGGRLFRCFSCDMWLCEDDQFEHQASCQQLDSETFHCLSCNRIGIYTCLRCKICFCDEHVKGLTNINKRGEALNCKKCSYPLKETKDLSVSVRQHKYGRQGAGGGGEGYYGGEKGDDDSGFSGYGDYNYGDGNPTLSDEDYNNGDDDEEDDEYEEEYEDQSGTLGIAALNIKDYKEERGEGSNGSSSR